MGRTLVTGLDIATSCVRAAELSLKGGSFRLERFAQMPLPVGAVSNGEVANPTAVGTAIKHLWKHGKFKNKTVSIGVASQRVVVRMVEIPWVPAKDRRRSLPLAVADQIPMPVDQAVLDFVPLDNIVNDDGSRLTRGLLVAAAEDSIMNQIAAAEAGGLRVSDVDLTPFALVRALCHADPLGLHSEAEAVVDVGASTSTLVIHVNGIPQFVRILLMGGQDVTDRLMGELGVNLPTAESLKRETLLTDDTGMTAPKDSPAAIMNEVVTSLVDEIRGSLDYFIATVQDAALNRVVVTGGGSLVPGFMERLEHVTGLPVLRGTALMALGPGNSGLGEDHLMFADPMSAAAVGLAVRLDG